MRKYFWKVLFAVLILIGLLSWNIGLLLVLAIVYVWLSWLSTLHRAEREAMRYVITDNAIRFTQDVSKVYLDTKRTPLETEWKIPFDDVREVELFSQDENASHMLIALQDKYGARLQEHKSVHLCSAGNDIPLPSKVVIVHTKRDYPAVFRRACKPISYILTPENPDQFYSELQARAKNAEFRENRYSRAA